MKRKQNTFFCNAQSCQVYKAAFVELYVEEYPDSSSLLQFILDGIAVSSMMVNQYDGERQSYIRLELKRKHLEGVCVRT